MKAFLLIAVTALLLLPASLRAAGTDRVAIQFVHAGAADVPLIAAGAEAWIDVRTVAALRRVVRRFGIRVVREGEAVGGPRR